MTTHSKKRILILFAHPSQERSEVNRPLFEACKALNFVTGVDLYGEYPNLRINIDREQQRLLEHDVVVFMYPMYWYSTPAILKEWQDLVLEYGFAYGDKGHALKEKLFFCAVTAGGPHKAYQTDGYNHYTLRELLHPIEQTMTFVGMTFLAPFVLFGSRTALDENRVTCHIKDWIKVLNAVHNNAINLTLADTLPTMNDDLDNLITEIIQ